MNVPPPTAPLGGCPLCGVEGGRRIFELTDRLHGVPGRYAYARCPSCRTVYQDPCVLPEELAACYPAEYLSYREPPGQAATGPTSGTWRSTRDRFRQAVSTQMEGTPPAGILGVIARMAGTSRTIRERVHYGLAIDELLPRVSAPRRALEIGCGTGSLLRVLERLGWDVEGVEWSEGAAAIARRVSGRAVWSGDFRSAPLEPGSYDLVVLNHVYEHLPTAGDALVLLRDLLTPRGRLVLVYPDPESLGARIFGRDWMGWDAPRHLVLPPRSAVVRRAGVEGLECVSSRTLATSARWFLACSQALRDGRPLDLDRPPSQPWHQLVARLEAALSASGAAGGEEAVLTFRRGDAASR